MWDSHYPLIIIITNILNTIIIIVIELITGVLCLRIAASHIQNHRFNLFITETYFNAVSSAL